MRHGELAGHQKKVKTIGDRGNALCLSHPSWEKTSEPFTSCVSLPYPIERRKKVADTIKPRRRNDAPPLSPLHPFVHHHHHLLVFSPWRILL